MPNRPPPHLACLFFSLIVTGCDGATGPGFIDAGDGDGDGDGDMTGDGDGDGDTTRNPNPCNGGGRLLEGLDGPMCCPNGEGCSGFTQISASTGPICGLLEGGTPLCWGIDSPTGLESMTPPPGTYQSISMWGGGGCTIDEDGTLGCWNRSGAPLDWEPEGALTKVVVKGHACAIRDDGTATCTPYGGSPGDPDTAEVFVDLDVGDGHACGIRDDGGLTCWGKNDFGQSDAPGGIFTAVTASGEASCAVEDSGAIVCWGRVFFAEDEIPTGTFVDVGMDNGFACAASTGGALDCWDSEVFQTVQVGNIIDLSVTLGVACFVDDSGAARCIGMDGFPESHLSGQSSSPSGTFMDIAVFDFNSCGVRTDGSLACWGRDSVLEDVPDGVFVHVTVGERHACALDMAGFPTCWGLMVGTLNWVAPTQPDESFIALSAGRGTTCGLREDRSATCWGPFVDINGTAFSDGATFKSIEVGKIFVCGHLESGGVECAPGTPDPAAAEENVALMSMHSFGDCRLYAESAESGDLICGSFLAPYRNIPTEITDATQAILMTTGQYHTCLLWSDGRVACWGFDGFGQVPAPAGSFVDIEAGRFHTCGLRDDGEVVCWGAD